MSKKNAKYSQKIGLPPGTLIYVGKERTKPIRITEINFSPEHFEEKVLSDMSKSKVFEKKADLTSWINIDGVHHADEIQKGGEFLKLDQLTLEDILDTSSRPRFDDFDDYLFLSMRVLSVNKETTDIENEQLSVILGKSWVLSVHESENDIFENIRSRIRNAKGLSRHRKEDFIFYRLIDITVDNYYYVSDYLGEEIERLEEKVLFGELENVTEHIFTLKKKISLLKKVLVPLREAVSTIIRTDTDLIAEDTYKYFRDVLEHIQQEIENTDTQREIINDYLNLYMTNISNKMNDVMKVLTIFASIFIPLTFIAGIYGMNFDHMPELHTENGYFIIWGVMIAVAGALLIYFRRKRWI
jgi:magnesium transporter